MIHWERFYQRMSVSGVAPHKTYTYRNICSEQKYWVIALREHAAYSISWQIDAPSETDLNALKIAFFEDGYKEKSLGIKLETQSAESVQLICTKLQSVIPFFVEVEEVILRDLSIQSVCTTILPAARK